MCARRPRTPQRFALILLTIAVFSACLTATAGRAQTTIDPERFAHETEIGIESGTSVGNYVVFGYAEGRSVKPIDIEYDRHEWGRFLTARVDYVAEAMPMLLMNEPAKYGLNTLAEGPARQEVYGGGFYPTGARFLWRYNKKFRPYLIGQGGILYFENRVLSPEGAKLNYSGKFGIGAEEALSPKLDLRIGYSDLHVSNGDTAPHNPGIDFMYLYIGVSYRLRNK